MLYNQKELPRVASTAGKVTILTVLAGFFVFVAMLVIDFGAGELSRVSAQNNATTTLTVLNTPPQWTVDAYEAFESSTTSPTNSGQVVVWNAIGTDSNDAPYFLLICGDNATPTANGAASTTNLGTAPPQCATTTVQWAVSTATPSGTLASTSTTTLETAPFGEVNEWYAWICDDDPFNPRCNPTFTQGLSATNSSPFHVNRRPVFSVFANDGPVDPGGVLNFQSTSSDPDIVGGEDEIFLVVCQTDSGIDPVARTCNDTEDLASTSPGVLVDASAVYTLASIVRDATYPAYGYIVDEHGHLADTAGVNESLQADFTVNNVAPEVLSGDISLNGGNTIVLTEAGDQTTGFTLDFTITDANSCVNTTAGLSTGPFTSGQLEITNFIASVYRSGVGSTTCDGSAGVYDPNNCYPSGVATSTWNLNCTASSTSCGGATDDSIVYNCTFPLWFVADPTDSSSLTPASLQAQDWRAAVSGIDNNALTGLFTESAGGVELNSFTAIDLITAEIPYGALEPGENSNTLNATTTTLNVGNTGLDQEVEGESMCTTFAVGNECPNSASSTIPESEQQFASSSLSYGSPLASILSSSTPVEVELNVPKTASTTAPNEGITYWGIAVPSSITLAGNYRGLNTYFAVTAEAVDWGI